MGVCASREVADAPVVRVITTPPMLQKKESDMNLVPTHGEAPNAGNSDESLYDREKFLVCVCPPCDSKKPTKVVIYDIDPVGKNRGKVLSELTLPTAGDEVLNASWIRSASNSEEVSDTVRTHLVLPCMNTSRIYVLCIEENTQLRLAQCIDTGELNRRDVGMPLAVSTCPGRGTPLYVTTMGDRNGHPKGQFCDFVRIDRKNFTLMDDRVDDHGPEHSKFTHFGGNFAINARQNLMITTEWGPPKLVKLGFQLEDLDQEQAYGTAINIWDLSPRRLRQTIRLNKFDGSMTMCVRFYHNPELNHSFACSAVGGCIFHIHKDTRNDEYRADKVAQFPAARVDGWIRDEMPAMPVDMVISMDDQFLYVACWLHGFIAQFNITDPFRLSLCHKLFLGGAIHRVFGVKLQRIATVNFAPERKTIQDMVFEGGPGRLQLSLDGRRLYVTNSFFRPWDDQIYPNLTKKGSVIALVNVNTSASGGLQLDEKFGIRLDGFIDGPHLAHEMRFLNGDSTSDTFA